MILVKLAHLILLLQMVPHHYTLRDRLITDENCIHGQGFDKTEMSLRRCNGRFVYSFWGSLCLSRPDEQRSRQSD